MNDLGITGLNIRATPLSSTDVVDVSTLRLEEGEEESIDITHSSHLTDFYPSNYRGMVQLVNSLDELTVGRDRLLALQENDETIVEMLAAVSSQIVHTADQLDQLPQEFWTFHELAIAYEETMQNFETLEERHLALIHECLNEEDLADQEDQLLDQVAQVEADLEALVDGLSTAGHALESLHLDVDLDADRDAVPDAS